MILNKRGVLYLKEIRKNYGIFSACSYRHPEKKHCHQWDYVVFVSV